MGESMTNLDKVNAAIEFALDTGRPAALFGVRGTEGVRGAIKSTLRSRGGVEDVMDAPHGVWFTSRGRKNLIRVCPGPVGSLDCVFYGKHWEFSYDEDHPSPGDGGSLDALPKYRGSDSPYLTPAEIEQNVGCPTCPVPVSTEGLPHVVPPREPGEPPPLDHTKWHPAVMKYDPDSSDFREVDASPAPPSITDVIESHIRRSEMRTEILRELLDEMEFVR